MIHIKKIIYINECLHIASNDDYFTDYFIITLLYWLLYDYFTDDYFTLLITLQYITYRTLCNIPYST